MFTFLKKILATSIILTSFAAGCSKSHSDFDFNFVATGLLDDCLSDTINYENLTNDEYIAIQKKIEKELEANPNNFSVNLLQFELQKNIIP